MSVESIYYIRNLNVIPLYSFLSNFLQSLIFGSKAVSVVIVKLHSSDSYPTIQSQLEEQNNEPLESPAGNLVTFFDNIEKCMINNYCVRSKSKSSVHH